jgi:hypothetical protein
VRNLQRFAGRTALRAWRVRRASRGGDNARAREEEIEDVAARQAIRHATG